MSIIAREDNLRNTVSLIDHFRTATGLLVNWTKSIGYWFVATPRPSCTDLFDLTWVPLGSLSTLLGAPFGITLATPNVDNFLKQKISKKISYWSSQRLSLAGRATVVNAVLLSSLYFFIAIWCGSLQVIRAIRGDLRNYLWSSSKHLCRARVAWG